MSGLQVVEMWLPRNFDMRQQKIRLTHGAKGVFAALALATSFVLIVRLLSGSCDGVIIQVRDFGVYIAILDIGFGVQIWLWSKMRALHEMHRGMTGVSATTTTTSATTMLACCSHYLAAAVPFLGLAGFAGVVTEYQKEVLLLGIATNLVGIAYLWNLFQRHTVHMRDLDTAQHD